MRICESLTFLDSNSLSKNSERKVRFNETYDFFSYGLSLKVKYFR